MKIKLDQIHKVYSLPNKGKLEILNECHLEVPSGSRVCIIGPSGVGKSTLMHILGLLDRPSSGEVYFNDQAMSRVTSKQLAHYRNQKIGFVFQHHYLLGECTALENVLMPALIREVSFNQARQDAEGLLRLVGLMDRAQFYPAQLSGGERQRIALARALINKPHLILADEVTGSLDPSLKEGMMQLLIQCCTQFEATLISVTHDFSLIQYYDTVYKLDDGQLSCYTAEV